MEHLVGIPVAKDALGVGVRDIDLFLQQWQTDARDFSQRLILALHTSVAGTLVRRVSDGPRGGTWVNEEFIERTLTPGVARCVTIRGDVRGRTTTASGLRSVLGLRASGGLTTGGSPERRTMEGF